MFRSRARPSFMEKKSPSVKCISKLNKTLTQNKLAIPNILSIDRYRIIAKSCESTNASYTTSPGKANWIGHHSSCEPAYWFLLFVSVERFRNRFCFTTKKSFVSEFLQVNECSYDRFLVKKKRTQPFSLMEELSSRMMLNERSPSSLF